LFRTIGCGSGILISKKLLGLSRMSWSLLYNYGVRNRKNISHSEKNFSLVKNVAQNFLKRRQKRVSMNDYFGIYFALNPLGVVFPIACGGTFLTG
jgi:hypothetical protein